MQNITQHTLMKIIVVCINRHRVCTLPYSRPLPEANRCCSDKQLFYQLLVLHTLEHYYSHIRTHVNMVSI